MYFVNLSNNEVILAQSSVNIPMQKFRLNTDFTWQIFYSNTPESADSFTLLVKDLSSSVLDYTWDTSLIKPGQYTLKSVAKMTDGSEFSVISKGQIEIKRTAVLALNSHTSNQLFLNNNNQSVSWTLANAGGYDVRFRIEYQHSGGDFKPIPDATAIEGSGFNWDISNTELYPRDHRYRIKLTAYDVVDPDVAIVSVESKDPFGIATTLPTYWQDVYPTLSGCKNCHANDGSGVGVFNMEDFSATTAGALQMQTKLIMSLDKGGTMPIGNPESFNPEHLGLMKIWSWGGAAAGVPPTP
jgi:hypothetical protein